MINQRMNRRESLKLMGAAGLGTMLGASGFPVFANGVSAGRVVVVGGGFGGATAAKYLKILSPSMDVTLIEPHTRYITCPFSNLYIGGIRPYETLWHDFTELREKYGVRVIHDLAADVDAEHRRLTLAGGDTLAWDRLVLSPGIDLRWGALEGYDEAASAIAPHAWKPGEQSRLLRRQLEEMEDGGTFVMVAPDNPFRCPPGPYERVSMVAHYFKEHKPRSKILILDAKDGFSKQGLFMEGWRTYYGDMIEWVSRSNDGRVVRVDAERMEVETEFGEVHKASVLNVIPPQKAGSIADRAGVTDATGWVPIHARTFESQLVAGIYVIGDATQAAPMPKSGFMANTQAKITARSIVEELAGRAAPEPTWVNTCYSMITPESAISVAGVYEEHDGLLREVPGSGGVSPMGAGPEFRHQEADYARAWYAAITQDVWGSRASS